MTSQVATQCRSVPRFRDNDTRGFLKFYARFRTIPALTREAVVNTGCFMSRIIFSSEVGIKRRELARQLVSVHFENWVIKHWKLWNGWDGIMSFGKLLLLLESFLNNYLAVRNLCR